MFDGADPVLVVAADAVGAKVEDDQLNVLDVQVACKVTAKGPGGTATAKAPAELVAS